MTVTYTKRKPDAFQSGGHIYDWWNGHPMPANFSGTCLVGDAVFKTWIDQEYGERAWQYLKTARDF